MDFWLEKYRRKIDKIDKKIIKYLSKRGNAALKIAKLKAAHGLQVYHHERERSLLQKLFNLNRGPFTNKDITSIYEQILNASRALQAQSLENLKEDSSNQKKIKISVQGIAGSFSEQVAQNYCVERILNNHILDYAISSRNVVDRVISGESEIGVLALCNNWGGIVTESVDALNKKSYHIMDTYKLMVKQNLLVKQGVSIEDITDIYSHSQALAQCQKYLIRNFPNVNLHATDDTAQSALKLSKDEYSDTSAVIAAKQCSKHYGLRLLEEEIQDNDCNETLFLIITKQHKGVT